MSELILNMYQSGAVRTAIYPGTMVYPILGLCGEVGELPSAINKDRYSGEASDNLDDVKKEIGDVLWYVANVAEDMDTRLSEVMGRKNFEVCRETWNIDDALIELPIQVGVVAENMKKAIRDNDGNVSHIRGANILASLCLIVTWLERLCSGFGATLDECAQLNLDKLRSRAARGVLKGNGDAR